MYGLFEEIGPLRYNSVSGKVEKMNVTWGSDYHVLFIDNPVGTGFSVSDHGQYVTNEDQVGECLLNFIQQFLQMFPDLRKAPLFLTGESYAGKYIPAFGHYIHTHKNARMPINLKGMAIGNGWIDPPSLLHYADLELQMGLIDIQFAANLSKYETKARELWAENRIDEYKLAALKAFFMAQTEVTSSSVSMYNILKDEKQYDFNQTFLNDPKIQDALHVHRMLFNSFSGIVRQNLIQGFMLSVKPWLEELLEHYGVMCYSGQLDVIVGYALSMNTYKSLNWTGTRDYIVAPRKLIRSPSGKLIGFEKSSGNFMDVMVRGAGHMVPTDKPEAAKQIIDMFINKFSV